jgi:hypothetical protein
LNPDSQVTSLIIIPDPHHRFALIKNKHLEPAALPSYAITPLMQIADLTIYLYNNILIKFVVIIYQPNL